MKFKMETDLDLNFRPADYFEESAGFLANIMGEWRREQIREALKRGEGNSVPKEMFASELTEPLRQIVGSIHPRMMGGEYLPALLEGEVEIARVSLASTTGDVISLRARRDGDEILYRLVDEYDAQVGTEHKLTPQRSAEPLTLGELVQLIDTAKNEDSSYGEEFGARGLVGPLYFSIWEQGDDLEELRSFVRVTSEFYPDLEECFDERADWWYETFGPHEEDGDED